ncbi:hypothetical protein [Microbacterium thalassium]|uniref:Uncharacterized protein n=1 Tax=Microbacterium thalassium TaxID=362649 RepID=A0A7X0KUJ3_9MICO|nr:hypothetical protein [Microbacterium thalassium]MBB6391173.1 hypothetical protein [Microbacterium thalassium]GLK23716.1 hypothetical protein GCM10017607_10340 [Microbacterium thalassium]
MDSTTFTAYRLDQHRAQQLARESELIRRQRERASVTAAPYTNTHTGLIARLLRAASHRGGRNRVASAH